MGRPTSALKPLHSLLVKLALSFWAPPALRMLHLQEEFLLYPTFEIDGACPLLEFISPGLLTPRQALSCLHHSSATCLACFLGSILLVQPTNIYQVQTMCQVLFETLGSDADQSQSPTCRQVSLTYFYLCLTTQEAVYGQSLWLLHLS